MARKKINKRKSDNWTRLQCYYIWQINNDWPIVLYDWVIIEDLGEEVICSMMDRSIDKSDDFFKIKLQKKIIKLT